MLCSCRLVLLKTASINNYEQRTGEINVKNKQQLRSIEYNSEQSIQFNAIKEQHIYMNILSARTGP